MIDHKKEVQLKRSPLVEKAHRVLTHCEKGVADYILNSVNLTLLEKEIITKSEIDGVDLETICMGLENWKKKNDCSYANCYFIKRTGMLKIGEYLNSANPENYK